MEFCPECGAMMLPNNGVLRCNNCGYSNELSDNDEYAVSEIIISSETVKVIEKFDIDDKIKIDTSMYKPRRFNKIKK